MKIMQLIKDSHDRLCLLGKPTETPDPSWLAMQTKPFKKDAVFHSAYPLDGGAVIVDINDVENLGYPSKEQMIEAVKGKEFNPAADTIIELMRERILED